MQTVWFPVPVAAFFRRIVNVVSTLSISHHYLSQSRSDPDARPPLRWPAWLARTAKFDTQRFQRILHVDSHTAYTDLPVHTADIKDPPPNCTFFSGSRPLDQIHQLIENPALYDPVRKPRYPIVLCHGLYGFDVRGPSSFPILQQHYWSNVLNILRDKLGAEVLVTGVPSTGSVPSRAENLDKLLKAKAPARGVNFLAHSMGGLDCRYLISHIKPTDYVPLSLTTVATPHRGSPFMDWCRQYLGLGRIKQDFPHSLSEPSTAERDPPRQEDNSTPSVKSLLSLSSLPSSFTTLLLSILDSPAYANLTTSYLNTVFNPYTPDDPSVKYFSVAARCSGMNIWHPLWLPKMVLDGFEERERTQLAARGHPLAALDTEWGNDGLVTVQSARWGEFLGVMEGCDHWEVRGARGLDVEMPSMSIPGADGWNFADWGRFVRAWKREEKEAAKSAGAAVSERGVGSGGALAAVGVGAFEADGGREEDGRVRRKEGGVDSDEVVRNSTDKVSAVFDWIVDHVPSSASDAGAGATAPAESDDKVGSDGKGGAKRNDLATKMDLERFYVALCRKLYDEGL